MGLFYMLLQKNYKEYYKQGCTAYFKNNKTINFIEMIDFLR